MATTCLNCGTEVTSKYCPDCGQKATVDRLTWHHLLEETAYIEFLITGFYRFGVFYIFFSVQYILALIIGFNPESQISLYSMAVFFMAWTIYVFYDFFKLYNVKHLALRIVATMVTGFAIYSFLRAMFGKLFLAWGF